MIVPHHLVIAMNCLMESHMTRKRLGNILLELKNLWSLILKFIKLYFDHKNLYINNIIH